MGQKPSLQRVAIVGSNRIPFARINTNYSFADNQGMLKAAIDGLISRYNLDGIRIGELAGGAVMKHARESSLVRETVLKTNLDAASPAVDLQQACATGIETAVYIANKISLGQIECGIACGVDSASNPPLEISERLRKILLSSSREKSSWARIKQFAGIRLADFWPKLPILKEPATGLSMGEHTELTAKYYKIGREEQDFFAYQSHLKMTAAYHEGFFEDMMSPFLGLERDNNLRTQPSLEKLSNLRPSFDELSGTITAGNSTPLTDGASAILLSSEQWAIKNNLPILAFITFSEVAAIDYINEKQNLLLAPIYAANRMLQRAGYNLEQFDFYEIHEAFAAQVLSTLKIWESRSLSALFGQVPLGQIDQSRLNVKGGSLAAAHPFAATGGRIIATLAKLLFEKGSGKGFISVCAAGGQGITMILER